MPHRRETLSLRQMSILCIGHNFDLVCYGCKNSSELNSLMESDGYLSVKSPVAYLPSSLLEDMYSVICRRRCFAHYLHVLIQPQIRHLEIQPGTIHHAITFLQQRCAQLRSLSLTSSTFLNPELFIPIFQHFPNLVKLNLSGTVIDDRAFATIAATCHKLRYLNVSRSTISAWGLLALSISDHNILRCQQLEFINLEKCRVTKTDVASFLYYHPRLHHLVYEDTVGVLGHLASLGGCDVIFNISMLTCEGEKDQVDEVLRSAVSMVTRVTSIKMTGTRLTNTGLYPLMNCHHLQHLHIINTDMFQVDFDEGLSPILVEVGSSLTTLELDRFKHVDISFLGRHCTKLKKLSLSHVVHYGTLLALAEVGNI